MPRSTVVLVTCIKHRMWHKYIEEYEPSNTLSRPTITLSPGPFPAFQCCMLKSGRAWYAKSCADVSTTQCYVNKRWLCEAARYEPTDFKGKVR